MKQGQARSVSPVVVAAAVVNTKPSGGAPGGAIVTWIECG
jgi:hypothetical protein